MMSKLKILLLFVLGLVLVGCAQRVQNSDVVFETNLYSPRYATGFVIESDGEGSTLIRVTRPWQGEAIVEQRLAIFNTPEACDCYDGQYIIGPAERIVCMSSSHIAMLDAVGALGAVVGVSGKQYIVNEHIVNNAAVRDIGYDSNIDYEALLSLRPDLVLMYGITAENSSVTAKLKELNIPYLYLGDYTEQSPLGKAEWMVAVGEIVGRREYSEQLFSDVASRYEQVCAGIALEVAPKVMFNIPYQDVWYMPSDDSYMVRLVEDAGGEYVYKGKNPVGGSRGISLEEALLLVSDADIWLNPGQVLSMDELRSVVPHFQNTNVVKRGVVYNNNRIRTPYGGSDFWESAIVHPDVVLRDLAMILRGEEDDLYYHHKLH